MKKLLTLAVAVTLVALGSVSLASTSLNSFNSGSHKPALENNTAGSTQPTVMPPQTITICKKTIPAGGTGFPFAWANGFGSLPSFSLDDNQCVTKNMTGQDHYNKFTENVPSGWTLTNISCAYTTSAVSIIGANSNSAFQPGDNTVTVDLNETNVTCTFVNQQSPSCCCYFQNLSTGQGSPVDPLWQVNNHSAYSTPKVSSWMNLPMAKWIQPVASPTPGSVAGGTYKYTLSFIAPPLCATGPVQLSGSFAADNSAIAKLDGIAIPGASCPGPVCFNTPQAPVPLSVGAIAPGSHVLEIDVNNQGSGYSGLIVNAQLTRLCR